MSFASNFKAGTDIAGSLMEAFQTARQQRDLAEVANAKPQQVDGFTTEDVSQLEAAANSGQYNIGYDDTKKAYTVTPKADPSQTGMIAQQGVTDFMGKRAAGVMSDDQVSAARHRAFAEVLGKIDPILGMRLQREARQGEQADQRFSWDKSRNERDIRLAGEQDADLAFTKELDSNVGNWFKGRLKNPDGTERAATVDDHLAATQYRAAQLTQAGKIDLAGKAMQDYSVQAAAKLSLEEKQRDQAIGKTAAALAAGNLDAVKDFYNQYIPDGSRVTAVQRGANGAIVIQRETLDGRTMPETVMKDTGQLNAALTAFKDPMAIYNWSQNEFKNTLALNADKRADTQLNETMRHNKASEGIAYATKKDQELIRADAAKKAAAGVALYKEQHPGATPAQLEAVRTGILAAAPSTDQHAPSEVKLARVMVESGLAPDMRTGLEMAITKKGQSAKEDYRELMKPSSGIIPDEKRVAPVMEAMHGADWRQKVSGVKKETPKPLSNVTPEAISATAKKYGISEDEVKRRLNIK